MATSGVSVLMQALGTKPVALGNRDVTVLKQVFESLGCEMWNLLGGQAPVFSSLAPHSRLSFFSIVCQLSHHVCLFLFSLPLLISDQATSSAWLVADYSGWLLARTHLDRTLRRLGYHWHCLLQLSNSPLP